MKHPNRKAEASNKWWLKFLRGIEKAKSNPDISFFEEAVITMIEEDKIKQRRGGKTIPVDINEL
jgi:hypothetical protein